MKKIYGFGLLVIYFFICDYAFAVCGTSPDELQTNLLLAVNNKMIKGSYGSDSWQEFHCNNGNLWDYKQGPGHAIDHSEVVGKWSIDGQKLVHTYGSTSYNYELYKKANGYCLKGVGPTTGVDVDISIIDFAPPSGSCE